MFLPISATDRLKRGLPLSIVVSPAGSHKSSKLVVIEIVPWVPNKTKQTTQGKNDTGEGLTRVGEIRGWQRVVRYSMYTVKLSKKKYNRLN